MGQGWLATTFRSLDLVKLQAVCLLWSNGTEAGAPIYLGVELRRQPLTR